MKRIKAKKAEHGASEVVLIEEMLTHYQKMFSALCKDVKTHGNDICEICKWSKIDIEECTAECETCETLCKCYYCNKFNAWEWQGVQHESN